MQPSGGPGPNETRNVILAIVLSIAIFLGFEIFINGPARERQLAAQQAQAELQAQQESATRPSDASTAAPAQTGPVDREQAIAATAAVRIPIETGSVDGSILLQGARIDDLNLRGYHRTVDDASPEVTLLAPINSEFGHDAFFGWEVQAGSDVATLADASTEWTAPEGARLTPSTPVTLTRQAGPNLTIERTISIDENYMFTVTDTVRNNSGAPVSVRPFGVVRREGLPQDYKRNQIVHQGMIGAFGENNTLRQVTFENANKHIRDRARGRAGADERIEDLQGQGGWLGLTDHYWLTAIVPAENERTSTYFDARTEGATNDYRAAYRGDWREAPAGGEATYTQHLFAGAKSVELLQQYQDTLNIPRFDDAVDWGNFWFLTRPFFMLLHWLAGVFGGFGLGILATTVVVKLLLFPLVYHSFKAMAKMRGLQPKM
jgi:YidC/Oxa1 family membrane protein insertase